ncbi:MAG: zf-HC2 domain-containing protein [Acidobacteriaceae bacterium]|jgi:hypothetical protein|nr:zf-HC2 domain-containing protein [Acidobacteriaceae bacterium]
MQHPDDKTVEAFRRQQLTPAEMLAFAAHLAGCEPCRVHVESVAFASTRPQDWFPAADRALHLSEEEIAAAAADEGRLSSEARSHLSLCTVCRQEMDDARSFASPVVVMQPKLAASRPAWPVWSGLVAAGILLAVTAGHFIRHGASPQPVMVAELQDDGGVIGLNANGTLSGAPALPAEYASLLTQTLASHRLLIPAGATVARQEILRGEPSAAPAFQIISPIAEVTLATPEFKWQPMPQAINYRVAVYDASFRLVAQSPIVTQTTWSPVQALPQGSYTWAVKATTPAGTVQSPRPPAPEARFTVADTATAAAIASARKSYPQSHLLLAALYARSGMTSLAHTELDALQQENPGSPLVQQLTASLPPAKN